ncbi:MAG: hypothetical protein HJJLKODD_00724 [Phycisphaerae bacterium]|nr:hypothetical protein [Phycisphaerae bacterium]
MILLASTTMQVLLLLLAMVVIFVTITRRMARRQELPGADPSAFAQEQITRLKHQPGLRSDMEELLVQIQELARQINGQIDTKFTKLEIAIRDADLRIARLQQLLHAETPSPLESAATTDPYESTLPKSMPVETGDSTTPPEPADPARQHIYALADQGLSAVDIAGQTGQSTGEIELILALRPRT